MPVSKNALEGPARLADLADIHAMVGHHDRAIERLDSLLSMPSSQSVPQLRADPLFDPLRQDPRFRALLERHAP